MWGCGDERQAGCGGAARRVGAGSLDRAARPVAGDRGGAPATEPREGGDCCGFRRSCWSRGRGRCRRQSTARRRTPARQSSNDCAGAPGDIGPHTPTNHSRPDTDRPTHSTANDPTDGSTNPDPNRLPDQRAHPNPARPTASNPNRHNRDAHQRGNKHANHSNPAIPPSRPNTIPKRHPHNPTNPHTPVAPPPPDPRPHTPRSTQQPPVHTAEQHVDTALAVGPDAVTASSADDSIDPARSGRHSTCQVRWHAGRRRPRNCRVAGLYAAGAPQQLGPPTGPRGST
jgi:hypothetical protein